MTGHLASFGTERDKFVGKPGRKRIIGNPRLRWDCRIKIYLTE
jgi:hypothetical protein